jgi:hypothetical protein
LAKLLLLLLLGVLSRYLQQRGWDVTYLPVEKDGRINLGQLQESIRPDTALVSVMAVNNEIGETGLVFQGCGVGKGGMVCEVRQAL